MIYRSFIAMLILADFLIVVSFPATSHVSYAQTTASFEPVFQKGMSYTTYANLTPEAYSGAESDESLRRMRQIGVEYVAINVVGWSQTNETSADIHKNPNQAPTNEAMTHVIQSARNLSMKIMLKPMIDLENGEWRGKIQPSNAWFQNYTNYINLFAEFAQQHDVEIFCIGTEYKLTSSWAQQWANQNPSNYRLQYDMQREIDLQEQADCYEAAFQSVWRKSWFYGMYWWYWQTNPNASNAIYDKNYNGTVRDYTPQNKPAQGVIMHWYSLNWQKVPYVDYATFVIGGISLVAVIEAVVIGVLWRRRKSLLKYVPKG